MIKKIKQKIYSFFSDGHSRTILAKKNIAISFFIKGASIVIGLLLVPMTINYVSSMQYGIWLTISSLIGWMSFFDIGMGNGLRNKLAESLALNEFQLAKIYVSTTYACLLIISLGLFVFFCFLNPYIDWQTFLNIPESVKDDISLAVLIIFGSFCVQFVVQLINTVLTAVHKPAIAGLLLLIGQLCVLITIYIMKKTIQGNLTVLVLALTMNPVIILTLASLYFYKTKFKNIAPAFSHVDFSYSKKIFQVGGHFFIIQIGSIILLQTDNIIISKFIGPESVTKFNVALKLFSTVIMLFSIIMNPYWSAFTDANAKRDYEWIKNSVKKIRQIWFFISIVIVPLILVFSNFIYKFWLGDSIQIPFKLSLLLSLYVIAYMCLNLNSYFLNGVGKIRLQLYIYLIVCIVNIPLCCFLAKKIGINGIVISNLLMFVGMSIILWIQTNKVLAHTDKNIWSK
ncbi:MATE family efflux transporter [Flavobacterium sp. CFBP9031]|uniref:lipopolysaccharide biosynthesis protein n=1 Tax=Flavobacterium sp. CFBP9031 TaxID=3096538 RepID=UPI002A6AF961|nr:MATE family efflux transporter [Flavobacterium sp. CFBP9031]MDY0986385.1 MATE family efflux transporter [Flavobacterium sp. CFBP9031]